MKKLTHTTYATAHLSASENTLQGELSSLFKNHKKNNKIKITYIESLRFKLPVLGIKKV